MYPSIGQLNVSAPPTPQAPLAPPNGTGAASGSSSFKNMLLDSVQQVNSMQQEANKAMEGLFTGADVNPAEVLTAVQKADLAFRMLMQVRNKLVSAYQEIKDIRV
jgi:flagellar hook-basal body complex protein FliE